MSKYIHPSHALMASYCFAGLPPSPPSQAEPVANIPLSSSTGGSAQRPIGVGFDTVGHKISSATIAVIVLASTMGAVISLGVIWLILLKCNSQIQLLENTTEVNYPSA